MKILEKNSRQKTRKTTIFFAIQGEIRVFLGFSMRGSIHLLLYLSSKLPSDSPGRKLELAVARLLAREKMVDSRYSLGSSQRGRYIKGSNGSRSKPFGYRPLEKMRTPFKGLDSFVGG